MRSWLRPDGLVRLDTPWNRASAVATTTSELIFEHAAIEPKPVLYCGFDRWFPPLPEQPAPPAAHAVGEHVAERVGEAFEAVNGCSPDWLRGYYRDWVTRAAAQVQMHLQRGEQYMYPRPPELWTGSGGMLWTRLLRILARRCEVPVIGHDHGSGAAHRQARYKAMTDLENLNRFFTFSSGQARHLQSNRAADLLLARALPEIVGLNGLSRLDPPGEDAGIRRVIYVCSLPRGEVVGIYPRLSDIGFIDFEARMLTHLVRWGYDVVLKPHPSRSLQLPASFLAEKNIAVETRPLEEIWRAGDLLLFDDHLSTAFASAMRTRLPVVLIDFGYDEFTPKGVEIMDRRISLVRGELDEHNRAQVDWADVQTAIPASPAKAMSESFYEEYLR